MGTWFRADYSGILSRAPIGIYRSTLAGVIVQANQTMAEMLGYDCPDDIEGRDLRTIYAQAADRKRLVRELKNSEVFEDVEVEWLHRSGRRITVRLTGHVLRDHNGNARGFEAIAQDVTPRRRLEEQVTHLRKMEALGRVVGSVAHDFNNVLTAIIGFASMATMQRLSVEQRASYMADALAAAETGRSLTTSLLAVSRRERLQPEVRSVGAEVRTLARILRGIVGPDIRIECSLTGAEDYVSIDPGRFERALMNLASNARHAMPNGGALRFRVRRVRVLPDQCDHAGLAKPGRYIRLDVVDDGCGMDAETRSMVFEPFFTTRQGGTGLGLATLYGFIRQSGGNITVNSTPGRGAHFSIFLPVVHAPAERKPVPPRVSAAPTGSLRGVCLLAEDDDAVRPVVRAALEMEGLTVVEAKNGRDALASYRSLPDVALIVSDVAMPEMSGYEFVAAVTPGRPTIPVLYISGNTAGVPEPPGAHPMHSDFLAKPFSPTELRRRVRALYSRSRRRQAAPDDSSGVSGGPPPKRRVDVVRGLPPA